MSRVLQSCVWLAVCVSSALPVRADEAAAVPTHAERMAKLGLSRYEGGWRTRQEIELLERADREAATAREWKARVEKLRSRLDRPDETERATEELRVLSDPAAAPAVATLLAREQVQRVRGLLVEALGRIRSQDAFATLVVVALDHPDPETRLAATEQLAAIAPEVAAPRLVAALGSADNAQVNRAAEALGRLGVVSVAPALVASLETQHVTMPGAGGQPGSMSVTFTPSGSGLSMGGGPKPVKVKARNEQVLAALVQLTGANFQWDIAAWRDWLATQARPAADIDLRRG
ncbi:MAG: HEAT repeat domain-containing protein [Pirellulales bacterium]